MNRQTLHAIFSGGLIAGTLDVFAPVLINGFAFGPSAVMKFIAGGLIGLPAARAGGAEIAALGLLLQWLMSLIIAAIFALAATRLSWMMRRWIIGGFAYGTVVFVVMNYVVRPLSAIGGFPNMGAYGFVANLIAMWLFGLIIAYFTQRHLGHAIAPPPAHAQRVPA